MNTVNRMKLILYVITLITAFIILIDFTLPGKVFTEDNVKISKGKERYYNAGGNSHNTFRVIAPKHSFFVSEDFAKSVQNNKIRYSVSLIFREINRYELLSSNRAEIYSFRIASGLVLPLIVVLALLIAYKYEHKMSTILSVLQIALLINLILLIV